MQAFEVRHSRLVVLFVAVLLVTAYLPHPNLGEPLPQSIDTLIKTWKSDQ